MRTLPTWREYISWGLAPPAPPPQPEMFPKYQGMVVRTDAGQRIAETMQWGVPLTVPGQAPRHDRHEAHHERPQPHQPVLARDALQPRPAVPGAVFKLCRTGNRAGPRKPLVHGAERTRLGIRGRVAGKRRGPGVRLSHLRAESARRGAASKGDAGGSPPRRLRPLVERGRREPIDPRAGASCVPASPSR